MFKHKRKHDFRRWEYSDKQLERMCCYSKKYVISFRMENELISVGALLNYGPEESRFSALRRLVKLKHQTILNYAAMSIGIKKAVLTHIPRWPVPVSSKYLAHASFLDMQNKEQ